MLDLKANHEKAAHGTIIEAQLDKGRGPVATVLVQEGTLRAGDYVVSGDYYGRVRAMYDEKGQPLEAAGPSIPVQVIGLSGVPNAGDVLDSVADEKAARTIAEHRAQRTREHELAQTSKVSLETFLERHTGGEEQLDLNLIIKADVQGSVEALSGSLKRLSNAQVKINVVHSAVGAITETDVNYALTSNGVIIGFSVRPDTKAMKLAEQHNVDIKLYNIIYEAVDGVLAAMEGRLPTTTLEKYLGRAEIRQTFSVPRIGTVAGCAVNDGKLLRNARVRLLRDNIVVHDGRFSSLKRFKDDVREVANGYECGAGLEGYNDLKPGDVLEAYELIEVATKLKDSPRPSSHEDHSQPHA
jgi:translation initiation factor IF-2